MQPISYARHQFPPEVIRHAVWLYLRFTLSYRDVEELLAERGLDVSYETIRRWVLKFGPRIARNLRRLRPNRQTLGILDEMVIGVQGRRLYLWRAVDSEGEILDMLVQSRRDKGAALRLMRKLLKKQGFAPDVLVTDKLRSYGAARRELGLSARHEQGLRKQQPGRKLAPGDPTTRAQDAALQVAVIGAAFPLRSCRRPQHLQPPASSHLPTDASPLPSRGDGAVATRDCRRLINPFAQPNCGAGMFP